MKVQAYSFGSIKVQGKEYNQDLIVFPDKIRSNWWRKQGHSLAVEDIDDVIAYKPELLVVGLGASGMMRIEEPTKKALAENGIELIAKNTDRACDVFNEHVQKGKNIVGAFHLTC
jgi:hypothetical protein